ncbi:MAG: gliding motility protein GldL [Bacteroidia bacterium]|nr:gliding motility protein GldL [Bacteroidia bacterium]
MAQKSQSIFESKGWKNGMKYLYGWGAAVVIIGALFKILHLPGANEMLIVGLGTEAVIFFFSAFEPLPHEEAHWEWNKVFPQLNEDAPAREIEEEVETPNVNLSNSISSSINKHFSSDFFESLSDSLKGLKSNVSNLADIADTTTITNEFSSKMKNASVKIDQLSSGYSSTIEAMKQFSTSINEVKGYQEQVVKITGSLASLNAIYEVELKDTQNHLKTINKFYANVQGVMNNMVDTSKDAEALKGEVVRLAKNMSSLNNVYGNMLAAMGTATK